MYDQIREQNSKTASFWRSVPTSPCLCSDITLTLVSLTMRPNMLRRVVVVEDGCVGLAWDSSPRSRKEPKAALRFHRGVSRPKGL